jgi:predicted phosphodiesterase
VRFLILSDLHGNWRALEAILANAKDEYDQAVCCGDIVGYNPDPAQVLEWTRKNCFSVVRGNHDKVVAGIDEIEWFNQVAQIAAIWTMRELTTEQMNWLRALPKGPLKLEHFYLCHGAPFDEDEYVITPRDANICFTHFELPLAFFGHTHLQGGFFYRRGRVGSLGPVGQAYKDRVVELEPDAMYMINPGSVGQPRDGDPRAAYALFDSETKCVQLRRVEYNIEKTAEDIRKVGLPDTLALRLFQGM